jgi:predicted secreted protein
MDSRKFVRMLVVLGVSEPKMTEAFLLKRSYKVVDRLATIIMELSGMKEGSSVKSDVSFRQESGLAVPISVSEGTT